MPPSAGLGGIAGVALDLLQLIARIAAFRSATVVVVLAVALPLAGFRWRTVFNTHRLRHGDRRCHRSRCHAYRFDPGLDLWRLRCGRPFRTMAADYIRRAALLGTIGSAFAPARRRTRRV